MALTSRTLADRESEWAQQTAALSHLQAQATDEETAQAICDELGSLRGLANVLIVALDAAGQAVPRPGPSVDLRIRVNSPIPAALTAGWAERLASGPWVGTVGPGSGRPSPDGRARC
ncbi:MAG: hypothetical protein M5T61_16915 [Acidimicrobiia bacterium]|nr:hypothetical protein [Acidimicrobiia bacterium]